MRLNIESPDLSCKSGMVDSGMEQTLVGSPWQERVSQAQQPEELTARCPLLEEGGQLSAMGQLS